MRVSDDADWLMRILISHWRRLRAAMKILCWNYQGLGSPWTVCELESLIKQFHPDQSLSPRPSANLGELRIFEVVLVFWYKCGCQREVRSGDDWRFMGFYGHPETTKRKESWALLTNSLNKSRRCLEKCNLVDIGSKGLRFTWCNHMEDPHTVRATLDKAVASAEWAVMFLGASVRNIPSSQSDHSAILVETVHDGQFENKKHFQFEAMWLRSNE
ncbi:UNVERIFIED_CONTAM: hypothetical protein Slati_4449400 [Sesamum latifolium]|uniref:Uncharacterized protein n=1 Tax=Sesamum latifolium TaxID=2727402 RepID=A0AAW2SQX7_9LAMI